MTRNDYVLITGSLRRMYYFPELPDRDRMMVRTVAMAIANDLAKASKTFDWHRFIEAATGEEYCVSSAEVSGK